jgi:hypothetical protein
MLIGQYFGWRHYRPLHSPLDRDEQRGNGHRSLTRPHLSLQQAMHGIGSHQVGANLGEDPLLGAGQSEWQTRDETLDQLTVYGVGHPAGVSHLATLLQRQRHLQPEEFIKDETAAGGGSLLEGVRKMDVGECLIPIDQGKLPEDPIGYRVLQGPASGYRVMDDAAELAGFQTPGLGMDGNHSSGDQAFQI